MAEPVWSSLEIVKLCVSALTPLAVAVLGLYLAKVGKRLEHLQWRNQRLIEKRIAVYDDLAPLLNDLLCYFTFVGPWKELTPPEVIGLKRLIDKKIYLAAPLFSPDFLKEATGFMSLCYATFQGWGRDARLRTLAAPRREAAAGSWDTKWEDCFADEAVQPGKIASAYQDVMRSMVQDIGLYDQSSPRLGQYVASFGQP